MNSQVQILEKDVCPSREIDLHPQVLSLLRLLSILQSELEKAVKSLLVDKGLSERSLFIMAMIDLGANRPSMLIEFFDVKASTMTFEVNKLVESGLVTREIFAQDRRFILLALTAEGRRIHKQMTDQINDFMTPRVKALKTSELQTFIDIGYKIAQRDPAMDRGKEAQLRSKKSPAPMKSVGG
jgi:DNA-binding MarR family transcriptional regulator